MAFRHDGALLVGGGDGLRLLSSTGCALEVDAGPLSAVPLGALTVHPRDRNVVYAATTGEGAALYRSVDGGEHWMRGATLPEGGAVTSMVAAPDVCDEELSQCVAGIIERFRFNPGPVGGSVTYAYTLRFAPQG